jgi:hypothetical protein
MATSTTSLRADEVMDRAAALMNDPAKTDYTYSAQLPYLNMALDELMESMEESNASPTNKTAAVITLTAGLDRLTPVESATLPHYPYDLVEVQQIGERTAGTENDFIQMTRVEFPPSVTATAYLQVWAWEDQEIRFNSNGATGDLDLQLKYVSQPLQLAQNELSIIGTIGARSYLSFKTAALCSMFIGENETRAGVLEGQAIKAIERMLNINSKGRQQIYTRRRPFRAAYKSRGWV